MGDYNRNRKSKPIRSNYARFGRKDAGGPSLYSRPRRDSGGRRRDRDGQRRNRDGPEMHTVTCDKCGTRCEVPFRPTGDKPVYCRDCFRKEDSSSSRGDSFERRDSRRSERRDSSNFERGDFRRPRESRDYSEPRVMHEVVCDKCGKTCEVPFKPTPGKPIYCNECFRDNDTSESKDQSDKFAKEIEQINEKLDKIMKSLNIE